MKGGESSRVGGVTTDHKQLLSWRIEAAEDRLEELVNAGRVPGQVVDAERPPHLGPVKRDDAVPDELTDEARLRSRVGCDRRRSADLPYETRSKGNADGRGTDTSQMSG
jgi:hypothetical protein